MDAGSDLRERPLTPERERAWQSFSGRATPFHSLAWRDAVSATFDYTPRYRLWYRGDDPVGAVPAFDASGSLVNPFCEYGFSLLADDGSPGELLCALAESRSRQKTLLIKDADWTGIVGYNATGFGGIETGTARRLDVDTDISALREHVFDRSLRKNVRAARNRGLSVRRSDLGDDDLDTLYDLHLQTVRRKGSPQFPREFFGALASSFEDDAVLYVAELDSEPVGVLLGFDHRGTRSLWTNASASDSWDVRPNDVLYYRAVCDAAERSGLSVVDFGRSEPGSGVDRFKRRFGGQASQLTTLVAPPHRVGEADVSGLRSLQPIARRLAPIITHPAVGPRLKEYIHE